MDAEGVQAIRGAHAQQQESGIARGDSQANDLAQRREAEETRRDILATLLEPAARERCEYIYLLMPEDFAAELTCGLRRCVKQYLELRSSTLISLLR
jgi:DNA-binding TFAR19-related protein (PDSD5 family)